MVKTYYPDEYHHIFTRSIAKYKIFSGERDYLRFKQAVYHYQFVERKSRLSRLIESDQFSFCHADTERRYVKIVAYCLMPTHVHLVLRAEQEKGVSRFISNLLNSYTRYFNTKYERKGPLWEGRYKKVHITSDEQLFHTIRYVHLNPVTDYLVKRPEEWKYSSYREYLGLEREVISDHKEEHAISAQRYQALVNYQIDYQRKLAKAKSMYTS